MITKIRIFLFTCLYVLAGCVGADNSAVTYSFVGKVTSNTQSGSCQQDEIIKGTISFDKDSLMISQDDHQLAQYWENSDKAHFSIHCGEKTLEMPFPSSVDFPVMSISADSAGATNILSEIMPHMADTNVNSEYVNKFHLHLLEDLSQKAKRNILIDGLPTDPDIVNKTLYLEISHAIDNQTISRDTIYIEIDTFYEGDLSEPQANVGINWLTDVPEEIQGQSSFNIPYTLVPGNGVDNLHIIYWAELINVDGKSIPLSIGEYAVLDQSWHPYGIAHIRFEHDLPAGEYQIAVKVYVPSEGTYKTFSKKINKIPYHPLF